MGKDERCRADDAGEVAKLRLADRHGAERRQGARRDIGANTAFQLVEGIGDAAADNDQIRAIEMQQVAHALAEDFRFLGDEIAGRRIACNALEKVPA